MMKGKKKKLATDHHNEGLRLLVPLAGQNKTKHND